MDEQSTASAPRPQTASPPPEPENSTLDVEQAVQTMRGHAKALRDAVEQYINARIDLLQHAFRRGLILVALLAMAAIFGLALIVTATVFFCLGIARGLDAAFNSRWLGELITGATLLAAVVIAVIFFIRGGVKKSDRSEIQPRSPNVQEKRGGT